MVHVRRQQTSDAHTLPNLLHVVCNNHLLISFKTPLNAAKKIKNSPPKKSWLFYSSQLQHVGPNKSGMEAKQQEQQLPETDAPISPSINLLSFHLNLALPPSLQVDQLMCNKLFESLQVLSIELHIIVSSPFDPERLHRALTAFIQSQAMREVNDLVLRAMNNQDRRRYLRNLIDAVEEERSD